MKRKECDEMEKAHLLEGTQPHENSRFPVVGFIIAVLLIIAGVAGAIVSFRIHTLMSLGWTALAIIGLMSVKVAPQWQKAIVLRLGKLHKVAGPGLFVIIPLVDRVVARIDQRIMTTTFTAEQTLTKDTVPVDVDAVLFWVVWDAEKAALEVANYKEAVSWAAQTALREVIGRTLLSDILASREEIDEELRQIIDSRTEPWGIAVQAVEIRDVLIPASLQEAMSREAQAERERRARIILGTAETEIAIKFAEAAKAYENNSVAFQLRAMNILYEGLKEKGALVVVPSSAVETMGLGTAIGLTSLVHGPITEQSGKAPSPGEASPKK